MTSTQPASFRARTARKCAVYLGSSTFVELDDDPSTITLEDLCEAFGTPWESGMHVKHRATGRVIATLPFEPLPSLDDLCDVPIKAESTSESADTLNATMPPVSGLSDEDLDEAGEVETTYAVVYDLVTSTAGEENENSELAAAVVAAGLSEDFASDVDGGPTLGETMRQLVELGAAELLTAEPLSVSEARREYNPSEAPGLLRRIVYPASQYSPYRLERDPLSNGKRSLYRSCAIGGGVAPGSSPTTGTGSHSLFTSNLGEGLAYTSFLDSFSLNDAMGVHCVGPLVTGKLAIVTRLSDEEQNRIFGV
ncbi:hypothetical protein JKF63_01771 [Porcisia hertigi]|uniref:Uncharacterized protein n=1 Tax=Porcisia hertigi TaxID=2761500 RepID=A0A836L0P5_9TRYP|nr:hypothetical protein JKF63_01771 [Porcisia hertigi]